MTMYAFPSGHNPKTGTQESGMTLRDYFAAKAMSGILSNSHYAKENPMDINLISGTAYDIADCMLKARDE